MPLTIELRGTGDVQLRAIVREGFPLLVRGLARHDRTLPGHVDREFRAYLGCGDATLGFAWLECGDCSHHRHVATRQWVLTVPWRRRWLLARRPDLADGVLRVALRQIARWYRKTSGRRLGQSGSVTAIQRFGSALNLNLHFHVVHLDGVFDRGADGKLRFFTARPTTEDVEALVLEIALACERWLGKQGFAGEEDDSQVDEDDAQGVLQLASLRGTQALGERAGRRVRRVVTLGGKEVALSPRCASYAGYNVHANVALRAREREGLERLCRYVLRRVWSDGTSALDLSPLEFVEKLAALVPPPRANQVLQVSRPADFAQLDPSFGYR